MYHGSGIDSALKEYVKTYDKVVENLVRARNRLKAVFRKRNISCPGARATESSNRQEWLQKLDEEASRRAASVYYDQIELLEAQQDELAKAMTDQATETSGWESLLSLPGFGEVRAARTIGIVGTPWRFRTKRQLWRYSGLAIEIHDSSQYTVEGPDGIEHRQEVQTRGLNKDGNPKLKDIFRGAAETAIHHYAEANEDYHERCKSKAPRLAKLDIARKLASQCVTIWKRAGGIRPREGSVEDNLVRRLIRR